MFLQSHDGSGVSREFVEAYGYSLAEVHGAMLFAGGDAQEPMAVADVFIRKAAFFRTEKKGDGAGRKAFADEGNGLFKAPDWMLQLTLADGGRPDDERAIFYGFGDSLELFGAGEQWRGADCGTRLTKGQLVGVNHAKMEEAEVTHGAGGSADVEGIARTDEDDAQMVGFGVQSQGRRVYSRTEVRK